VAAALTTSVAAVAPIAVVLLGVHVLRELLGLGPLARSRSAPAIGRDGVNGWVADEV
jgi:hypothetical protein